LKASGNNLIRRAQLLKQFTAPKLKVSVRDFMTVTVTMFLGGG
jgi:hypothetical protein